MQRLRSSHRPRSAKRTARGPIRATIPLHVRFLRQAALLLPSAFLLDVLVFLLTHGRTDPGFGTYPFFQAWAGERAAAKSPELRFLMQSAVFFVPAYLAALLFVLSIAAGERALFGRRPARKTNAYARAFAVAFPLLYLAASVALLWWAERAALRQAPGLAHRAAPRGGRPVRGGARGARARRGRGRRRSRSSARRWRRDRGRPARSSSSTSAASTRSSSRAASGRRASSRWSSRRTPPARRSCARIRPASSSPAARRASTSRARRVPAVNPLELGVPVLGLCYGMQWIAQTAGGGIANEGREYGRAVARIEEDSALFAGLECDQTVWMNHGDSVVTPPAGISRDRLDARRRRSPGSRTRSAASTRCSSIPRSATRCTAREVLENFLFHICKVQPDWTMSGFRAGEGRGDPAPGADRAPSSARSRAASTPR